MVSRILIQEQDGTPKQIVFADHSDDFGPAAATDLRISEDGSNEADYEIELANVADGAARQSDKADLGENRALEYSVRAAFEFGATPSAGETVELYWAPSPSGTAGSANPGNVSGADAEYAGYSSDLDASLKQMEFIGAFVATAQAAGTVQVGEVAVFAPSQRYGSLIVVNRSGAAFHSNDIESHVVFDPLILEQQ
jgi:hypothetical protein